MLSAKSSEKAAKFREKGNEFLVQSKSFDALLAFNRSLCYAETGSLDASLTFERRSEAFLQISEYEKCLNNIQAAKEHGYPQDKIDVLNEREEKCRKMMKEKTVDLSDDPWSFFKLSYPPNEKIPFIVDCLELCEDKKFGRHVITTHDLQPGDVIAIEQSHFNFISPKSIYTRCFNCLKSNCLDLIPSSASVMFCSAKCCTDSYKKFNGKDDLIQDSLRGDDIRQKMLRIMSEAIFAAGSFSELENLVENIDRKTVFDYDFSDPNDDKFNMKILACISSLMPKEDCGVAEYLNIILTLPNGPKKDFFVKFISRVILNYMRNGVKLPGKGTNLPDGGMLLPFVSIVNHSCDPNIFVTFIDTKCVFVVIRCIKAGEQIFDNYRKSFMEQSKEQRQAELLKTYEFTCECTACANNFPMPNKLRIVNKSFTLPSFGFFGSSKDLIKELQSNFRVVKELAEDHPCFESSALTIRNREIIRILAERA